LDAATIRVIRDIAGAISDAIEERPREGEPLIETVGRAASFVELALQDHLPEYEKAEHDEFIAEMLARRRDKRDARIAAAEQDAAKD
jgi:hypothetical protein